MGKKEEEARRGAGAKVHTMQIEFRGKNSIQDMFIERQFYMSVSLQGLKVNEET